MLAAVLAWALYTVRSRPFVQEHGPIRATAWSLLCGTLMFLPMGAASTVRVDYTRQPPAVWGAMLFVVVFTGFLSYLCWLYALARLEPSRVAVFTNLQPLCVAVMAWLLRGAPITPRLALGGAVVTAGVLLATWRRGGPETRGPETRGPETRGPETRGPETRGLASATVQR